MRKKLICFVLSLICLGVFGMDKSISGNEIKMINTVFNIYCNDVKCNKDLDKKQTDEIATQNSKEAQ